MLINLTILLIVVLGLLGLLFIYQDRLIFLPNAVGGFTTPDKNPVGLKSPAEYNLEFENIAVNSTDNVVLHTWFIKANEPYKTRPSIMFFQGNAGNVGLRIPNLVQLRNMLNANIIAVSYRGYGWSSGKPSEAGIHADAKAVLNHYVNREDPLIDPRQVFLFGRSLGGAVAIRLAHDAPEKIRGVIVENTFSSMREVVKQVLPPLRYLPWLLTLLLRTTFQSDIMVANLTTPILYISGTEDSLIPPSHMRNLFNKTSKTARLKWFLNVVEGTHNDSWQVAPRKYYKAIEEFLAAVIEENPQQIEREYFISAESDKVEKRSTKDIRPPFVSEVLLRQIAVTESEYAAADKLKSRQDL